MQPDAPVLHGEKSHRQHQRNGDADHQPRAHIQRPAAPERMPPLALVQPQAQKAHGQHDHHRLDQHLDEFAHRIGHRLGLVLHLLQRHAERQAFFDLRAHVLQRFAERDDVAALGHRHTQRNHLVAVVVHLDLRRVDQAALDLRDVAQPQLVARSTTNRHGTQLLDVVELAAHAHLHHVQRRLHRAGRFDGVLRAQLAQHLVHVQPQLGQALLRDFDVDLLVLHAEQLDLGHVLHAQQLLARVVGKLLQLGIRKTIARQRVDHAVHVAEIVVEERPLHALRQGVAHVAHLLAHRVPDLRHLLGRRVVFQLKDDHRLARLAVAADLVGVGHFLQRALDLVGDLLGHLLRRGAGPVGAHHHDAEGERRVFVLPELKVRRHAQQQQHHHQVAHQRRVLQRPARQVEAAGRRGRAGRHAVVGGMQWITHGATRVQRDAAGAAAAAGADAASLFIAAGACPACAGGIFGL